MFNYIKQTDSIEDSLENESKPQAFIIDSPEKANWAICKIKEARERRDIFNQAALGKIEQMKRRIEENDELCRRETAFLLAALDEYIEKVPARITKTQKTFLLPDGKLKKKFAAKVFKPDEEKLLEYLDGEEEYITVVKKPVWGEFKKLLKEIDGQVIRTDTGEIIEAVAIEERPEAFDVE